MTRTSFHLRAGLLAALKLPSLPGRPAGMWPVACRTSEKANELQGARLRGASVRRHGGAARPKALRQERRTSSAPLHRARQAILRWKTAARVLRDARWLGYLSTTGVYGDHGGGWVDEDAPARPVQQRSIERLATERAWQARWAWSWVRLSTSSGCPASTVRGAAPSTR